MRRTVLLATCLIAASPALAQTAPAPAPAAAAAPDGTHQAAAARISRLLLPDGTYAQLMQASMDGIMKSAVGAVGEMPIAQLAAIGGMPEEELAGMGEGTLKEMMAIMDPAFERRMEVTNKAMISSMTRMMTEMEPSVREGLAAAMARRFSTAELQDLERFFATPTGAKYAAGSMLIYADPEMIAKMQEMIPKLMESMPDMMKAMTAATADLPKPRMWEDLSAAEKQKLAELLGTSVKDMEQRRRD